MNTLQHILFIAIKITIFIVIHIQCTKRTFNKRNHSKRNPILIVNYALWLPHFIAIEIKETLKNYA